jgi:hypothetical protein
MFHQSWTTRDDRPALSGVRSRLLPVEPIDDTLTVVPRESTS